MKTEVYSWRVSADLKTGLMREAHRRKISLAALLDLATRDWLNKGEVEGVDEQARLHANAAHCLGALAGSDTHRAEDAVPGRRVRFPEAGLGASRRTEGTYQT